MSDAAGATAPRRPIPIITFTTDFGTRDSYVAEMKAVILGLVDAVHLVDITHEIARHDILGAALVLEAAAPRFPPGTVHVAVVDPGVGTGRRGLVVRAGAHLYVGPDNGLFTPVYERDAWAAWELAAPEYRLPRVSRTFHGRDVFAPAAAHLARGVPPSRFGPPVTDPVRLPWPRARRTPAGLAGAVIHVDRFGNLVTSIGEAEVEQLLARGAVRVRLGRRTLPLVGTYGELAPGAAGALVGSHGRLEIAVREASAAARLRARPGTPVAVSLTRGSGAARGRGGAAASGRRAARRS